MCLPTWSANIYWPTRQVKFLRFFLKAAKLLNVYWSLSAKYIHQNQFDALVSFTYNCGKGALKTSTLLKKLNQGDIQGAAQEFLRWNKASGQVLAGLTRRRTAEMELFLASPENPLYEQAIDTLVEAQIITSPQIWKDRTYIQANVRDLIIKVATKM